MSKKLGTAGEGSYFRPTIQTSTQAEGARKGTAHHVKRQVSFCGVADHLKWYVYRLIDPRNGETFYVGKGRGNRVFEHSKGALSAPKDEDVVDLKLQRIKEI